MKKYLPFLVLLVVLSSGAACASSAGSGVETAISTEEQTHSTVSRSEATQVAATAVSTSTADLPPIDLVEILNGDEVRTFLEEVGAERAFPSQLMTGQPELPDELSAALAKDFLADSRVLFFRKGLRDTTVLRIVDYCDNGVSTIVYAGGLVDSRQRPGRLQRWVVAHTDLTTWNTPYIVREQVGESLSYIALGYDGVPGTSRLNPPQNSAFARIGPSPLEHIRVFDYPSCPDPEPILEMSPEAWSVLGVGGYLQFPDDILWTSPQLESDELVEKFDNWFTNLVTYENLTGLPMVQYCADHRGVILHPDFTNFGAVFEWSIVDASHIWPNMVFIRYENFSNGIYPDSEDRFFLGPDGDKSRPIAAASNPDCSVEKGLEYVESILDERSSAETQNDAGSA